MISKALHVLLLLLLIPATCSLARTWHVSPDGMGDAPSIPDAADSSAFGDTILVAPGDYVCPDNTDDSFYWIGLPAGVSLIGIAGATATRLVDHALFFYPHALIAVFDVSSCLVKGFSLVRDITPARNFYGILLENVSDSFVDSCTFDGFEYSVWVEGRSTHSETPCVRWCRFTNCSVGVQCDAQPGRCPVIQYNDFSQCDWGIYCVNSSPYIADNHISDSRRSGIYCFGRSAAVLDRNVIVNSAEFGLYVETQVYWEPVMTTDWLPANGNSIYNSGGFDLYNAVEDQRGVVEARYTYWGSACPDFAKAIGGPGRVNYVPWSDSAHAEAFDECPPDDAIKPSSWGALKALYR